MKTMKKTYINPELEVVKIQTMQMLAASDPILGGEDFGGSDPILAPELGDDFDFSDGDAFTFEEESFDFGE